MIAAAQRRVIVQAYVDDRGCYAEEVQATIAREDDLPPGVFLRCDGQFENQPRAMARLSTMVQATILMVGGLIASTLLTLFVLPTWYPIVRRDRE